MATGAERDRCFASWRGCFVGSSSAAISHSVEKLASCFQKMLSGLRTGCVQISSILACHRSLRVKVDVLLA
jgi:hypothetical protein